jgi:hypothetical protein
MNKISETATAENVIDMPSISTFLPTFKQAFGPQIINNRSLNPVQAAIGIRGYHIQSKVLHIPDRFGFFSPGPLRLQVREGALFVRAICFGQVLFTGLTVLAMLFLKKLGQPWNKVLLYVEAMVVLLLLMHIGFWVLDMVCHDGCQAPDYEWEEESEVRKE